MEKEKREGSGWGRRRSAQITIGCMLPSLLSAPNWFDCWETITLAVLSFSQTCTQWRREKNTVFCFAYLWGVNLNYVSFSVFPSATLLYSFYPFNLHPCLSPLILLLISHLQFFPFISLILTSLLPCFVPFSRLHLSPLQVSVWTYCRRGVVVLYPYHHLLLHGQPGCFPHRGEDGVAHRERRGLGQADRDSLRDTGLGLYKGVLQGMDSYAHLLNSYWGFRL